MITITRRMEFDAAWRVKYKSIPGFPGYRIGDDGSVWSAKRRWASGKWRLLSQAPDSFGYLRVGLEDPQSGKQRAFSVHRLVLLAFVGPCPEGMEARHFPDRNPSNNRLKNLSWASPLENAQDKVAHGTAGKCVRRGEQNGLSKLTAEIVRQIREWRGQGITLIRIAERVGELWGIRITLHAVHMVVKRKNWKHV